MRFSPYWALVRGNGCVASDGGGWTQLDVRAAGHVRIATRFSLRRVGVARASLYGLSPSIRSIGWASHARPCKANHRARLFPHGPVDVLRQVLLFAAAYYAYRLTRGWIDDGQGAAVAFENARHLINLEQNTHLFVERDVQQFDRRLGVRDATSRA